MNFVSSKKFLISTFLLMIALSIVFRFYKITDNHFMYYDEGMWLQQGRLLHLYMLQKQPNFFEFMSFNFKISLPTGKALWAFVANLRAYISSEISNHYWTRLISAFSGIGTLGVLYFYAVKYLKSKKYALLSCAFLAVMPAHVYYSRLGLQESLTTLLFLSGVYFYVYGRHFLLRTVLAGTLWAGVYFGSYRMIILPIAIVIIEICRKDSFDARRLVYSILTFMSWIFILGSLHNGANIQTTFGWMFHQSHLANNTFDFFNLLSFPYYLVHFNNGFFALLFLLSITFVLEKNWEKSYPIILFCIFAFMFSFSQEKGVRYLTFLLPFIALSAAAIVQRWLPFRNISKILTVILPLIFIHHMFLCSEVASFSNAYQQSIEDIEARTPQAKILSSQAKVQSLFVSNPNQVIELHKGIPFLLSAYQQHFQYMIIDPQAYVSLTNSGKRFDPPLDDYLQFVVKNIPPVWSYEHFSGKQLEWFVWEHNENFQTSYRFLRESKEQKLNSLNVYDLNQIVFLLRKVLTSDAL